MSPVTFNDTEFRQTIQRIKGVTNRPIADSLNRFAYFAARGASRNTVRVPKETIESDLGKIVRVRNQVITKTGKVRTRISTRHTLTAARDYNAPLAAILVNVHEASQGRPGLYGAEMRKAVEKFIAFRIRSRAFLASGWLPAIQHFAPLVKDHTGAPKYSASYLRQFGKPKGGASDAKTNKLTAIIWNAAGAETKTGAQAMEQYTKPALEQALAEELQSSKAYLEKELQKAWQGTGSKVTKSNVTRMTTFIQGMLAGR